jgi:hypothetical protein
MTSEEASDWRLISQDHMQGLELEWSAYTIYREGWDHDHCEFCRDKFSVSPADLNAGYRTPDRYRWVCRTCFDEFEANFEWKLLSRAPDPQA